MIAAANLSQLDALREVASIGCGRAVTALGRLTGRTADMEVPEVRFASGATDLARLLVPAGNAVLAVGVELAGLLGGRLALALPERDARRLAGLLGQEVPDAGWTPLAESAVLEAGNIVGSAFVSAVGRLTGVTLLLSVPELARGAARDCLPVLTVRAPDQVALVTRFSLRPTATDPQALEGLIVALPDPARIPDLLAALPGT
jgi:chemotaxis protein CheC